MAEFATFADFLSSGLASSLTEVSIDGVTYKQRATAPLHEDFRYQDGDGAWWSPDYYVVVAGGQSNMVGGAGGAAQELDPNVMMYDAASGSIVPSYYANSRNNLYLPYANELAETLGRPVLVVAAPVNGSRIDTWLESGTGTNWDTLDARVSAALALVGQDHADNFIWLQGESDFPIKTADFVTLLTEFIGQVRSASWAGDAMTMLIGELSREGVHATQNQAMQLMELAMRDDPFLRFVSSTGLTSDDLNGVHFTGESLVDYGHRFFEELMEIMTGTPDAGIGNTAPFVQVQAAAPLELTLAEGQELRLSPDLYFADAEGDSLWLYGSQTRRSVYFLDNDDGDLVIRPLFSAAGVYTLRLYASDGELDSQTFNITVTVTDATPLATVNDRGFTKQYYGAADAEQALHLIAKSRGVDILSQAALPEDGRLDVDQDNLTIRGGAGIHGTLELSDVAVRVTLAGSAAFDVETSDKATTVYGNGAGTMVTGGNGADRFYGYAGNDTLRGGAAVDYLYGGADADELWGEQGDDRLYGEAGSDVLTGGAGKNQYWGGTGADVFVFSKGEAMCLIQDFSRTDDHILISGRSGITDFASFLEEASVLSFSTSQAHGVRFTIDGEQLQLFGVTMADLTADRFLFG
ncbi:sialate O-acetylesterase [Neotabrizicola shimadae]|uniref:Sialate O-acetylesterase domain-containing protein n=1 Tax=Neotabrizicola shimadae TaxID=2807096 RepID=A0A8G0ZRY6_9RHOB|nr:sialate O-acetylesterase [Neotabrizicola shimadae]QYZ68912.1 hypothetical protein JO391_14305 [Neotabrizicola shimadae]